MLLLLDRGGDSTRLNRAAAMGSDFSGIKLINPTKVFSMSKKIGDSHLIGMLKKLKWAIILLFSSMLYAILLGIIISFT